MLKIFGNICIGLLLLSSSLSLSYLILKGNIHAVIPNQYYRSGQLTSAELTSLVKILHIKSIINLRGQFLERWYRDEIKTSKVLGVQHYDVQTLNAYVMPTRAQLQQLVYLLQKAPPPVLIHCEGGADRSSLASAFVVLLHNGSVEQAKQQVSWRYLAIKRTSAGYLVLPIYQHWLKQHNLHSTREQFLKWLNQFFQ